MKIEFDIIQTGAVELTENLGEDFAFTVPVKLSGNNDIIKEAGEKLQTLYYHASEGWKPVICGDEKYVSDLHNDMDDELINRLSLAFNELGNTALEMLFQLGEQMWDSMSNNKLPHLTCVSVSHEDVDRILNNKVW